MADIGKYERHLDALRQEHAALEAQIDAASRGCCAAAHDEATRLKQKKLRIKDEIVLCERDLESLRAGAAGVSTNNHAFTPLVPDVCEHTNVRLKAAVG